MFVKVRNISILLENDYIHKFRPGWQMKYMTYIPARRNYYTYTLLKSRYEPQVDLRQNLHTLNLSTMWPSAVLCYHKSGRIHCQKIFIAGYINEN